MTVYISSGNSGLANFDSTWSRDIADGIGNHTAHHCYTDMSGCSFGSSSGSALQEIDDCTNYILQRYDQRGVWTMASPYGEAAWGNYASTRFILNRRVGGGTLNQNDLILPWHNSGYYEIALDAGSLTLAP